MLEANRRKGTRLRVAVHPNDGTTIVTRPVLIAIPAARAGKKLHGRSSLLINPIVAPATLRPTAIGRWSRPSGKPLSIDVTRCPIPLTNAPSPTPKYKAAKNPGEESKAIVGIGAGK
jgi:hypothetical protein